MGFSIGPGISYNGRLIDPSGNPVIGSAVQFRLQIRTPGPEDCLLYEEVQTKDLSQQSGMFSLTIHDGTGTRLDSSGFNFEDIFSNRNAFTFTGTDCAIGSTYTPAAVDGRNLQVLFNDGTFDPTTWEPGVNTSINFAPMAIEALQIAGYKKDQLIKIADGVPTSGTELNAGDWASLLALLQGTSTQYPSQSSFNSLSSSVTTLNSSVQNFAKNVPATCGPDQALTFNSTTNSLVCSNIAIVGSQVSGNITGTASNITGTLAIANGGTNSTTALNNNQLMVSTLGSIKELGAMTDGQIVVGKNGSAPQIVAITGDVSLTNAGVTSVNKIGGTTVGGVGLSNTSILQNTSGSSITANNLLISNGTATGVTSLSTPVSGILVASGSVPLWATLSADSFTQYALLAGRSSGQNLKGGTAASENLTLDSTAHATKGNIILDSGHLGKVGIGTSTPTGFFEVDGGTAAAATDGKSIILKAQSGGTGNRNGGNIILTTGVESGTGIPGNVGIGTTNPSFTLDIEANQSGTFASLNPGIFLGSADSFAINSGTSIGIGGFDGVTYTRNYGMIGGFKENGSSGNYAGYLAFATRPNGSVPAERMRITSTGNVGIGMSPNEKLDVTGNINISSGSSYLYNGLSVIRAQTNSLNYFMGNSGNITMTGTENTSLGDSAFLVNTTGSFNVAVGGNTLRFNSAGNYNTAIGKSALKANTTGSENVAIGYHALYSSTAASNNTALGNYALELTTTGSFNTSVGYNSLGNNTSGQDNTAVGHSSLANNTTGDQNTAVGIWTLTSNISGQHNSAFGDNALSNNTTADGNSAFGFQSLSTTTTGSFNTGVGHLSLSSNTTGFRNTGIGRNALISNTTGNQNTALGDGALYNVTTGSYNLGLGKNSGDSITTGAYNVILGANDGASIATLSNYILISDGAGNERMRVDNSGNVAIGATSATTKLQVAGEISPSADNTYSLGDASLRFTAVYAVTGAIQTSDLRQKKNIQDSDLGLDFINRLRPVSYLWKSGPDKDLHYGLIAQETEKAVQELHRSSHNENTPIVDYDKKSDRYGLKYTEFISPMIKAVQEIYQMVMGIKEQSNDQKRELASLIEDRKIKEQEIKELKNENAEIKARLELLEKKLLNP